jgi:hypothetical protein
VRSGRLHAWARTPSSIKFHIAVASSANVTELLQEVANLDHFVHARENQLVGHDSALVGVLTQTIVTNEFQFFCQLSSAL